jgi:predicted O-methyltransferase YrrM
LSCGGVTATPPGAARERIVLLEPRIDEYLHSLEAPATGVRAEMERYAAQLQFPIVGPLVGRLLQLLVTLSKPRRVFEMGSGFGYSAWWMARALPEGGSLECTETDADNVARGRAWLDRAGLSEQVVWHTGDAIAQLARSPHAYDLILNDVDKPQYPAALNTAWPRLRRGGLMVTDNALWSGRVVAQRPAAPDTAAIIAFTRSAFALPDAVCSIIPIRDGVLIALKT